MLYAHLMGRLLTLILMCIVSLSLMAGTVAHAAEPIVCLESDVAAGLDEYRRVKGDQRTIDGQRSARCQCDARRGDRAKGGIVDRCLAEEDVGRIAGERRSPLLRSKCLEP